MARIVWITERHGPDGGGMAVSSTRLVNALRDRGHSLTVLHLTSRSAVDDAAPFRLRDLEGHWRFEGWQGELERLFFLKRRAMEGCLLVGFGGGLPGYLASLWGKWLATPSVAMFRGNDLDRLSHDPNRGWMVHQTLRLADLACAVSGEMRSRIAVLRDGPVLFTPIGIIPDEWHVFPSDHEAAATLRAQHSPDGRPLVGIFGRLKYKKGLFTAIEIFRNYGMGKHARLLTTGDLPADEQTELEQTCREFWSSAPFVPRKSLIPYYLACDVVLIPSLYDGMPNVLLEAMLCGSAVVAGRAGGIPDVLSNGVDGFLFDAGDGVAAADTLTRALSLVPDARRRIGEAARLTVTSRFTGVREADILEAALLKLSGG
jgi:glycosyltransferase involved in cell wall biosynthesis